jgi:hypothetical protein
MGESEFKDRFNIETGRWDVIRRYPDGTEIAVGSYATPAEAKEEAARLTERKQT